MSIRIRKEEFGGFLYNIETSLIIKLNILQYFILEQISQKKLTKEDIIDKVVKNFNLSRDIAIKSVEELDRKISRMKHL
ncbi:MAG: PqqD family protein [Candidatus Electrothrix sp. AU1_5]|nr:PqqD family protein [Candidatus Electrothrix gigas]